MHSRLTHETRFENPPHLALVKAQFSQFVNQFLNQFAPNHDTVHPRAPPAAVRDEGTESMAYFYCALFFEFVIDANDGVRIYNE